MLHECPDPGCDFTSGSQNGVVMHYLNKPSHNEYQTKHEVYQVLDGGDVSGGSQDTGDQTDGSQESVQETPTGGTKLDLTALTGGDDEPDESGCPSCGDEDWFGAGDIIEAYGGELDGETVAALREHDRVCSDCGEIYG